MGSGSAPVRLVLFIFLAVLMATPGDGAWGGKEGPLRDATLEPFSARSTGRWGWLGEPFGPIQPEDLHYVVDTCPEAPVRIGPASYRGL